MPRARAQKRPSTKRTTKDDQRSERISARLDRPFLALSSGSFELADIAWWKPLDPAVKLPPGTPAPQTLRVPVAEANRLLKQAVRLVADLPAGTSGDVVWAQGDSELLVLTGGVSLACARGLVTVSVPVACDQLAKASVTVPFAVGDDQRTTGLVMSTFARPSGPAAVTAVWAEALTAFAWESLLFVAQELSGAVGMDKSGKKLVPGSIGAEANLLLVLPVARHNLTWRAA